MIIAPMHNYKLNNLTPFKSKWKNTPTKLIRIPEILESKILAYAHSLDNNQNADNSLVTVKLKEIIVKIDNKEKGYKNNSASQLIKDLKELFE
ncbi:hypothetical protein VKI21_11360 [Cyanobacterium aponinum UTEX 3222]|nr:hypothetical protein [Cyanobacterium aponinum]WRL39024.1 hypothetical protein VKI22_02700 [Cyanobacterium aponinum UTEX 3221]WRL40666.1 hypothetical protein VKI21_11360 [Cyanobacterium aponinum UTEX 3222]